MPDGGARAFPDRQDADFATVADDVIAKTFDDSGLTAGANDYKVVGRNAKGSGPESAVATVTVA